MLRVMLKERIILGIVQEVMLMLVNVMVHHHVITVQLI